MQVEQLERELEIASDGQYVWVNRGGLMVARYGPRGNEIADGGLHDYAVRAEPASPESFNRWSIAVHEILGIAIGETHRPIAAGGRELPELPAEDTIPIADPVVVRPRTGLVVAVVVVGGALLVAAILALVLLGGAR